VIANHIILTSCYLVVGILIALRTVIEYTDIHYYPKKCKLILFILVIAIYAVIDVTIWPLYAILGLISGIRRLTKEFFKNNN
jgi:hypothetical protein